MSRELHAENRQFKRFARHFTRVGIISDLFADASSAGSIDRADRSDEPFGPSTAPVTKGEVLEKWLSVEREVDDERLILRMCDENRASCQSPTALQFLAIVDSGRAFGGPRANR